jgi:hypothetical protein
MTVLVHIGNKTPSNIHIVMDIASNEIVHNLQVH